VKILLLFSIIFVSLHYSYSSYICFELDYLANQKYIDLFHIKHLDRENRKMGILYKRALQDKLLDCNSGSKPLR
jgi:hypothetical protein